MAGVTIKGRYTVKPAEPTWNGPLYLSEHDQMPSFVIPTVHFYRPSAPQWLSPTGGTILTTLRDSLSLALVHFYPLAGRLGLEDGSSRLRIDCNATGALLIEAESEAELDDFGDFSPREEFNHLTPLPELVAGVHKIPLLMVQVTEFRCGGISLGLMISHAAADGQSAFRFVCEWARLARGEPIKTAPFHDRTVLIPNEVGSIPPPPRFHHLELYQLPLLIGQSTAEDERNKKTTVYLLRLSKPQVDKLKSMANEGNVCARPYSRYEAIAAHVWRCTCRAREHERSEEQPTALCVTVDFRNRMRPALPERYFGNAVIGMMAESVSGVLVSNPPSFAAKRVREAIESVKSEYVWGAIEESMRMRNRNNNEKCSDFGRGGGEKGAAKLPFSGNPNLWALSWLSLPIYGWDFGWGKEERMGLGTGAVDGNNLILPGQDGEGSVEVACCLQVAHMKAFKKFFYEDIADEAHHHAHHNNNSN